MLSSARGTIAALVVCLIFVIGWSVLEHEREHQRRAKAHIVYGTRSEWLPWLRARWRSFGKTSVWVAEGYQKVGCPQTLAGKTPFYHSASIYSLSVPCANRRKSSVFKNQQTVRHSGSRSRPYDRPPPAADQDDIQST